MENSTRMILFIVFQAIAILAMLAYVIIAVTGN